MNSVIFRPLCLASPALVFARESGEFFFREGSRGNRSCQEGQLEREIVACANKNSVCDSGLLRDDISARGKRSVRVDDRSRSLTNSLTRVLLPVDRGEIAAMFAGRATCQIEW